MVLILPEAASGKHSPAGSTTAGLRASIEHALAMGCNEDMSRVTVRILGSFVVIEGLISQEDCLDQIMEIAEDIAGKGMVSVRLFPQ